LSSQAKIIYDKTDHKVIFWGADNSAFDSYAKKEINNFVWNQPINIIVPRAHYGVYNNLFIIHALKDLIKNEKITLTFPGWGDDLIAFKKLVKNEQVEFGVSYYNYLSREKFNEFLSSFDIYLSASLSDSSPASLIESMAAGLYPVVGDIPGVSEWINDTNGALFDLNSSESLKNTFEDILEQGFDVSGILKENNAKAQKDGMFSKNIKETVALMQERINGFGAK
ncbi:MAG: glycosyltransferase family 4 protein, partial [candidate division Zixibacteria bacterium]|nr:glycosyltransferase family 4 protein [candidate division Zixibacteria bacterium]